MPLVPLIVTTINANIKRKIRTKDWWKQLNTSIFGMILVDAMKLHQSCGVPEDIEYYPNKWFAGLVHKLINNAVEEERRISSNTRRARKDEAIPTLLPSKKRRKVSTANWRKQGRCCIHCCPQKATNISSVSRDKRGKGKFCCPPRSGRDHF